MKKRIQWLFLLCAMLALLTACRGGNPPAATTQPTTQPATTQATTMPTTQPGTTPTTDNGNGPLDTQPTEETGGETTTGTESTAETEMKR